jgi:phosphoribosylformylglycinamidine cyclo-ligase
MLQKTYGARFHESYDTALDEHVVYIGHRLLTDTMTENGEDQEIGKLLLSPTRTFAPVIKAILEQHFDTVHGLVHCSGGGQTKCLKYIPENTRVVKDGLFEVPLVFKLIQQASASDDKEMYQVFNMGTRMEIYTEEKDAETIIRLSHSFGIDAKIIGRVEEAGKKELIIKNAEKILSY